MGASDFLKISQVIMNYYNSWWLFEILRACLGIPYYFVVLKTYMWHLAVSCFIRSPMHWFVRFFIYVGMDAIYCPLSL